MIQHFTIKGRLIGINDLLGNYHKVHEYKTEGKAMPRGMFKGGMNLCYIYIRQARIKPVQNYPCEVYIQCFEPTDNRDDGNVKGGASKVILDALKNEGIIKDDSRKYIRTTNHPVETDSKNPRIEVTIIDEQRRLYEK